MEPQNDKKILLEHLESQYKLFRDEVRSFLGFLTASPAVLVALLSGELIVAKDEPRMLFVLPLTVLAYGAFIGCLFSFLAIAAKYSEMIERKINILLDDDIYMFEINYGGPKNIKEKTFPLAVFAILMATLPLALTSYGIYRIGWVNQLNLYSHPKYLALVFALIVVLGLLAIYWATMRMLNLAEKKNLEVLEGWDGKKGSAKLNRG
jgi:hypothetical protein